jgi:hypothetical protein
MGGWLCSDQVRAKKEAAARVISLLESTLFVHHKKYSPENKSPINQNQRARFSCAEPFLPADSGVFV